MVTRPPSSCSASESMVPKCSMIPVNIAMSRIASRPIRCGVRRTCHRFCGRGSAQSVAIVSVDECAYAPKAVARLPHFKLQPLHLAVDVLQADFDCYVGAELLHADIWQRRWTWHVHVRERDSCFAGKFRRVEKH